MRINKEGYRIIGTAFCLLAAVCIACSIWISGWAAWLVMGIGTAIWLFIVSFFREPKRQLVQDKDLVYAPADGKIVVIEEKYEKEYVAEKRIQVSIFMSLTNIHVNWYPAGGRILYFKYHPGKYLVAWHPKSSELNERTTTVVDTGKGTVLFRQIAGFIARRIVSYAVVDEYAEQNTKCGFIKFGSRLDVMLPVGSEILVKLGDKVQGSQTPIARLK